MTAHAASSGAQGRLRDLQSITDAALSRLDDHDFLPVLLDRARGILRADTAALLLLDSPAGQLVAAAAAGLEEEVSQGVRIPVGRGFAGRVAASGVPLMAKGKVIGVLHVGSLTPRRFTSDDASLLQLAADRAALAVQSLRSADD